jgi:hypothetical protein
MDSCWNEDMGNSNQIFIGLYFECTYTPQFCSSSRNPIIESSVGNNADFFERNLTESFKFGSKPQKFGFPISEKKNDFVKKVRQTESFESS